jgi:hypothetical protein
MVARITGTNKEEGDRILASANLITANSAAEAAQKAIALARAADGLQLSAAHAHRHPPSLAL